MFCIDENMDKNNKKFSEKFQVSITFFLTSVMRILN